MSKSAHRLVELLPDAVRLVVRAGDDELAVVADGERPDFAVVALQLLDVLELYACQSAVSYERGSVRTLSPSQYLRSLSLPTVQK